MPRSRDNRTTYQRRNERARELGFRSYYQLRKARSEVRRLTEIPRGSTELIDEIAVAMQDVADGGTMSFTDLYDMFSEAYEVSTGEEAPGPYDSDNPIWNIIREVYPRKKGGHR